MSNSKYISLSNTQAKGYARMYGVPLKDVATVYNPRFSLDFMGFGRLTQKIIEQNDILDADIVSLLPTYLSQEGKQQEVCLYVMAALKEEGKSTRLIFANSYAMSERSKDQVRIAQLRWLANKLGFSEKEVIFTSDLDKRLRKGCPEKMIRDLFLISNLFIFPSLSEGCSLIILEAAATKNLCLLNRNVPSIEELGKGGALWIKHRNLVSQIKNVYAKCSHSIKDFYNYYVTRRSLYRRYARKIIERLEQEKSLSLFTRAKKEFNEQKIFKTQLMPLIEE